MVAGDGALGQRILDRIERFVRGEGLSASEVQSIVEIRRRMDGKVGRTPSGPLSIKTDPGGIVDVEFIVQVLQIRHKADHLRSTRTLEGLDLLAEGGTLLPEDAAHLRSAFTFLRTVEKALRRQDERSRTRLPPEGRGLTALARAVGYGNSAAFLEALGRDMAATREIFQRLVPSG